MSSTTIYKTIECESEFNPKAWNKTDPKGGAKGIAQFLQPTFNRYVKKVNIVEPDVWNKKHAIHVMTYMFSVGQARQWSCFNKLLAVGKVSKNVLL